MRLTYKFRKPKNEQLDLLCTISKKLYNQANWYIRQDLFHLENWLKRCKKYIGKRIKRGLFRGSDYILNADVNGASIILRKVVGDDFIRDLSDRGCWFQPVRIRDVFQTSHEQFLLKFANRI